MGLEEFFLIMIVLFAIIYFAVRLAIYPLLHRKGEFHTYKHNLNLVELRDMEILTNANWNGLLDYIRKKLYKGRLHAISKTCRSSQRTKRNGVFH